MGYTILPQHVWNDGVHKSYTLKRPGLQAAMEAIRKGEIQVLVVGRYDRFSRIQMQQAIAIYQIEGLYGGRVESADRNEQFGKNSTGALLRSINAWRAERELELVRERTQGARRARAQSGKIVPAAVPLYGYVWADPHEKRGKSRYLVDPETAPVVERIYREAVAGVSLRRIAGDLTRNGIPTPAQVLTARGLVAPGRFKNIVEGRWGRQVIVRMLKNSAYCGEYVAHRYQVSRETDHERRHIKMRAETDRARRTASRGLLTYYLQRTLSGGAGATRAQ
jgi:DNA invertase Pin-like site-specific DNA recombinase